MHARKPFFKRAVVTLAVGAALSVSSAMADDHDGIYFKRIASFPAFENYDITTPSVAEIVAASTNGKILMYTDSENESLGFVDIKNPAQPKPLGVVDVGGEPTSVAVNRQYALVGVNTSVDFVNPSGILSIINIHNQQVVREIVLGGQPDSVAVSPNGRYAAIAIENERDEDLGDGRPPQLPAGFLVIVDMNGNPNHWTTRTVDLVGLADDDRFPEDPEPEYVDINGDNIAVVTLQENNHIVQVDLVSGEVIDHFSAGSVNLGKIDTVENKLIDLQYALPDVLREPDGVSWIDDEYFATADEGDLDGGSRGFTIFRYDGMVAYDPAETVEHTIVRHGHFPEKRADSKGNEPENVETGKYGKHKLLFVGSERASVVLVYKLDRKHGKSPELVQVLPTLVKPEGLLAIPRRGLFVAAGEEDERDDKIRAGLSIYKIDDATYPTVVSEDRTDGTDTPIPWGALSGLAIDTDDEDTAYSVMDSFYVQSRILKMDIDNKPAVITDEIVLKDEAGILAGINPDIVNPDYTVNLDPEGIATRADGGFWVVSEGEGPRNGGPVITKNLLLRVDDTGVIEEVVTLPDSVNARQARFGFEGVTFVGSGIDEIVYTAFQREWEGDPDDHVRIGRYDISSKEWSFYYYPIEAPLSDNGGWVGLSEIAYLGNELFAVIERDNQGGPDAVIKRIYAFSIAGLTPLPDIDTPNFPVLNKELVRDLMPDLEATGGLVLEKIEGLAVNEDGDAVVVNDNNGVDDSNGETQLLHLPDFFDSDDD